VKLELLRRPHWEQVPLVRCSSHRAEAPGEFHAAENPMRNLTATGDVYWSGDYWELRWLADVPYCERDSIVLFGLKGPPFYVDKAPDLAAALDLRPWSCAFGDHPWWWTVPLFDEGLNKHPAPALNAFFQERHARRAVVGGEAFWLNGLVQLQGQISPHESDRYRQSRMQSFVWERTGLAVQRAFRKATWLQGTLWTAPAGDVAGWLVWHYATGREERVPIVYGKTTARFWADAEQWSREEGFAQPVWQHSGPGAKPAREILLRLYRQAWENPRPDETVATVDFISNRNSPAGPFIVAVNLYP
jgi:hypothetical protein